VAHVGSPAAAWAGGRKDVSGEAPTPLCPDGRGEGGHSMEEDGKERKGDEEVARAGSPAAVWAGGRKGASGDGATTLRSDGRMKSGRSKQEGGGEMDHRGSCGVEDEG